MLATFGTRVAALARTALARVIPALLGLHMIVGSATEIALAGLGLIVLSTFSGVMRLYEWQAQRDQKR